MSCTDLPADLLSFILRRVLLGSASELTGQPLRQLASQWFAIRLTCKSWALLLSDIPLHVDVSSAHPAAVSWLYNRPVLLLRIGKFENVRERRTKSAPQLATAPENLVDCPAKPTRWELQELTASELLAELRFTSDAVFQSYWNFSKFRRLQVLHLKGALSPSGEPCSLTTLPLGTLTTLRTLHLERFTHFDLCSLPPSLRTLRLRFQETPMYSSQEHPALDVIQLPPEARLQLLDIDSRAAIGLLSAELVSKCERVVVRATRVYMGVHMPRSLFDSDHQTAFNKAHLFPELAQQKAEVMASTARHFIAELAGDVGACDVAGQAGGGGTGGTVCAAAESTQRTAGAGERRGLWGGVQQADGSEGQQCQASQVARQRWEEEFVAERCILRSLEFRWMCANTLVFVPMMGQGELLAPTSMFARGDMHWAARTSYMAEMEPDCRWLGIVTGRRESMLLALAQSAVHEGEEPVVHVTACSLADMARRQHCGRRAVRADYAVGRHQNVFLRLDSCHG